MLNRTGDPGNGPTRLTIACPEIDLDAPKSGTGSRTFGTGPDQPDGPVAGGVDMELVSPKNPTELRTRRYRLIDARGRAGTPPSRQNDGSGRVDHPVIRGEPDTVETPDTGLVFAGPLAELLTKPTKPGEVPSDLPKVLDASSHALRLCQMRYDLSRIGASSRVDELRRSVMRYTDEQAVQHTVFQLERVGCSPLYVFCLAVAARLDDVARRQHERALEEYRRDRACIGAIWRSVIPEELKDEAATLGDLEPERVTHEEAEVVGIEGEDDEAESDEDDEEIDEDEDHVGREDGPNIARDDRPAPYRILAAIRSPRSRPTGRALRVPSAFSRIVTPAQAIVLAWFVYWSGLSRKTGLARTKLFAEGHWWVAGGYGRIAADTGLSRDQVRDAVDGADRRKAAGGPQGAAGLAGDLLLRRDHCDLHQALVPGAFLPGPHESCYRLAPDAVGSRLREACEVRGLLPDFQKANRVNLAKYREMYPDAEFDDSAWHGSRIQVIVDAMT